VYLGADLRVGRLAEVVGRVAEEDVERVVDGLVGAWEVLRGPGEHLADTVARLGIDAFATHVLALGASFAPGPDEPAVADGVAAVS
jgi:dissimilatory sulfite reductase (desulfoviridin) alpha/beta subunit